MTRSHKANDPTHSPDAEGARDTLPRNFGKYSAHTEAPNKAKKNGGGKANWYNPIHCFVHLIAITAVDINHVIF